MKSYSGFYLVLLVFIISSGCKKSAEDNTVVLDDSYYTDLYNFDQTANLGRGINMGNFLESSVAAGGEGAWVGH